MHSGFCADESVMFVRIDLRPELDSSLDQALRQHGRMLVVDVVCHRYDDGEIRPYMYT